MIKQDLITGLWYVGLGLFMGFLMALIIHVGETYAQTEPEPEPLEQPKTFPNQFITIEITKNCFNILTQFPDHQCPTYSDLIHLDDSIPIVSGQFILNDLGFLERQPSPLTHHWKFFDFENKTRIYIDPPLGMTSRGQNIIITPEFGNVVASHMTAPNFSIYSNGTEIFANVTNSTGPNIVRHDDPKITTRPGPIPDTIQFTRQTTTHYITDRIFDQDCKTAYLDSATWEQYLQITIDYFKADCPQALLIHNTTAPVHIQHSTIDPLTSPNYQYNLQVQRILDGCLTVYGGCSTLPE